MWIKSYSKLFSNIDPKAIWQIWTDVNRWPEWHADLDSCHLEGAFEKANFFMLQPKGMKAFKIRLTEVNEGTGFTDCTRFLGAKMFDTHHIETTNGGIKITKTLCVTGPLKWLWIFLVARQVAKTVPEEIEALVQRARTYHG